MKVKIETEAAARLFNCDVGSFRDLQLPLAQELVASGDVSEVVADEAKPAAKRSAKAR